MTNKTGKRRPGVGFAAMDPARLREMASLGGKAAHEFGNAHEFTSETGRAAAKKRATLTLNKKREALRTPFGTPNGEPS